MAFDSLVAPLLRVPLFRGLKPLQITEIARRSERMMYRPGDMLIEEGQEAEAAILIISGDAIRVSGPDNMGRAEAIEPGSLLAEMGMLIETQHSSTVVARTPIRALRVTRVELLAQMAEDPDLADHFVQRIAGRLTAMATELRRVDGAMARSTEISVPTATGRMLPPPATTSMPLH
mgnify:CR=1 FL=1